MKKLLTAIAAFGLFSVLAPTALAANYMIPKSSAQLTEPFSASEILQVFDDLYQDTTFSTENMYDKINTDLKEARQMAKDWDPDAGLVKFVAHIGLKGYGYWFTFASKNKPGKIAEVVPTIMETLVLSEVSVPTTYNLKDIEFVPLKMRDMVSALRSKTELLHILDLKIDNDRDVGAKMTLSRNINGYLRWSVDFHSSKETDDSYPSQDYQVRTSAETTQSPYFTLYRLP